MASPYQISLLRLQISEPDQTNYTDADLSDRLDRADGDLDTVTYDIWVEKAARYAEMVDVSEGGSSRKMGDLHEQALNMAEVFKIRLAEAKPAATTGTRISRLRR